MVGLATIGRATVLAAALGACATSSTRQATIGVVLAGTPEGVEVVRGALASGGDLPITARVLVPTGAALETPHANGPGDSSEPVRIATARARWADAQFDACIDALGDDARVSGALLSRRRDLAASLLLWRAACHLGRGEQVEARRLADWFASLELDGSSEGTNPDVERLFGAAQSDAATRPRITVQAVGPIAGAEVWVDGRRAGATPCPIALRSGRHVFSVAADGYIAAPLPQVESIDASRTNITLRAVIAPPSIAAAQWQSRYGTSLLADSPASAALLGRAFGSQPLAVLVTDAPQPDRIRVRGSLFANASIRSHAERSGLRGASVHGETWSLLRDLLVRGHVGNLGPPIVAQPLFWVAVAATALVAGAGTVLWLERPMRYHFVGTAQ